MIWNKHNAECSHFLATEYMDDITISNSVIIIIIITEFMSKYTENKNEYNSVTSVWCQFLT